MNLTKGQIESFSLIAMKQIADSYENHLIQLQGGCKDDKEEYFAQLNAMWDAIWLYDPEAENNCLTQKEVQDIVFKMNSMLCLDLNPFDLEETFLNSITDFNHPDFNSKDFS